MNEQQRHDRLKARYKELKQSKESKMTNNNNPNDGIKKTAAEIAEMTLEQKAEYYKARAEQAWNAQLSLYRTAGSYTEQTQRIDRARMVLKQRAEYYKEQAHLAKLTPEERAAEERRSAIQRAAHKAISPYWTGWNDPDYDVIWRDGDDGIELNLDAPFE